MISPLETRLQQSATQISITQPRNLEIVEALENSPPGEKICVAVGKDFSESVSTLKWALQWALYNRSFILLHVQVPIRFIPSPVGRIPANQVSEDILNAHKEDDEKKLSECMEFFLGICSQARVKGEPLIIEKADVSKGIVEVVSELCITKLIIGTSSGGAISKKMKMQGPGKADYVLRHAIESCEVSIICKGKLVQLREAFPLHNGQKAMNCRIPLSQLLGERSETTTFKPCSVQGRLSVSFNPNVQRNSNASSLCLVNQDYNPAWVEELNDPDFEAPSFRQCYSREGSQESNADVADLMAKLQDALQEAVKARIEAQMEIEKRTKAEAVAIKAIQRFKESETAFKEAAKQKDDASSLLRLAKQQCEKVAKQRDEAMEELETIGEKLRSLETEVNEASRERRTKMEELEGARRNVVALEEQNRQILQQKDAALRQLQGFLDSIKGIERSSSVSSSHSLTFNEYTWDDLKAATKDFSDRFKLGEGRYGAVYKGEIKETKVAVKVLREEGLQGPQEFQGEMNLLSDIRHPNLVRILGTCSEGGCIVYEYMCNGSLSDRLNCKDASPPLPWHARIRIAAEICSALHYLHSLKPDPIFHRDLKPQNVLLDENYVCKISNFGIARIVREDKSLKTTEYVDPEYLRSGKFCTKSDIFSMGVIILQILTGKAAFGLVKEVELAMQSGNLKEALDPSAGEWPFMQTTQLAYFALHCTESDINKRTGLEPDVVKFLDNLRNFAVAASNPSRLLERGQTSLQIAQDQHKPAFFVCPIFKEVMENPYVAADGFTYEKEAIEGWFSSRHETSPLTNVKVESKKLIPNLSLRSAIRQWQEKGVFMHLMDVNE